MLRGVGSLGLSPPQSSPSCPPVSRWAHLLHHYIPGVAPWARHREYIRGRGPCPMPRGCGGDESPPTSGAPTELLFNPTPAAPATLDHPVLPSSPPFTLRSSPGPSQGWLLANPRTYGPCTCPPTSPCTQLLSPSWSPQCWQLRALGTRSRCRPARTAHNLCHTTLTWFSW